MKEKFDNHYESAPASLLEAPVIESFSDSIRATEVWPENIANNEVFLEQLVERKELNERLDDISKRLPRPDMSLETAISEGHITEEQTAKLYESLSGLMESEDYKRLALYVPFEFLPNKKWRPSEKKLQQATGQFSEAYMKAWRSLLSIYDVRANFVDGDVLEEKQRDGDLPRVVKAAHLIPKLVENGLLEVKDVIKLMEESDDEILKDSIADTLPVLADLRFLVEKEIESMEESKDRLVHNMARIIISNMKAGERQVETKSKEVALSSVQEKLTKEFSNIDSKDYSDITKNREVWLKGKKKQEAIEALGEDIGKAIIDNKFSDEILASFLTPKANTASQQALVEGIRKSIESVAPANFQKAQILYGQYGEVLLTFWENNNPETKEALAKTFRRLGQLGIVDSKELAELNIVIPKLAGPFSENLKSMAGEMRDMQNIVASIETNPELSKFIYPITLVFGSRLKGYGGRNADIDTAVFVRPETPANDMKKLRALLKETFSHEKIQGEVIEFWLEKNKDGLSIRDFEEAENQIGESSWTHVLFGAVWEGDKGAIKEIREKLLAPYLYDEKKMIHGREARGLYLEELERDTLQYRLMHKGYERFFPPYGGIHTPHADEIDGQSMFYDSGYRQLATKLFASKVFLPKISRP